MDANILTKNLMESKHEGLALPTEAGANVETMSLLYLAATQGAEVAQQKAQALMSIVQQGASAAVPTLFQQVAAEKDAPQQPNPNVETENATIFAGQQPKPTEPAVGRGVPRGLGG